MSEYVMKLYRCTLLGLYFIFVCTLCDIYIYRTFVLFSFHFLHFFVCTILFFSHLTSQQIQCILNILVEILYPYVKWYIWFFFVDMHICWCILRLWCVKDVISVIPVSYNFNILILWSTEPGTNAQYSQSKFNIAKY